MSLFSQLFGSRNQREIKKLAPKVNRINELGSVMSAKSDYELKAMTAEFKQRLDNGATLDDILCEAYAVVREAGQRALGMRHYDVQMIGGMVLHSGRIAEMRTGEGKTLVATLPTYLNALAGKGVHVVTVNDYLARRDSEWMGRLHGWLGLSTGVIVHGIDDTERQRSYNCDITYGQNNEFGFDYLRDNMKTSPDRMVQRGLNYAVVDEVDSILIDEARTPLIISGAGEASGELYGKVDRLIPRLKREVDYTVDEKAHQATLTDDGVERIQGLLSVSNLYEAGNIQLVHHVNQALRAHTLYKRDVNYLVEEGKVVIIDEHTGRKMPGRRWSDGLHQAIEAKEGVNVEEENQTMATVTFQNYFRMYNKLSGMTGTADTEAPEFNEIYKLDVVVIPTNKPLVRKDLPDLVYKNEAGKFRAVINEIEESHQLGQPVLVGTVSVEKSELMAKLLRERNLPFDVLNAKQHQREAGVVAQAGRKGAITIATNMAGRGTDILLGGNAEFMAKEALAAEKAAVVPTADGASDDGTPYRGSTVADFDEEKREKELIAEYKAKCDAERQEVLAAGGLKIIGTERHESRRIDNQLRGRAGRQGDPGASRFYLSLQDDLLRIFGLDRMSGMMERLGLEDDVPIESGMVSKSIENAQKKVEGRNFDQRKNVLEYDDVMSQQRKTIYAMRRQVLEGRYHPELSDDDKKADVAPAVIKSSGNWSVETMIPDLKPELAKMIEQVQQSITARDAAIAAGEPAELRDPRPGWRILRAEIWRQYGALLDLEKPYGGETSALVDFATRGVCESLVQQRERLYDLSYQRLAAMVEEYCPMGTGDDDWDFDALEDAIQEHYGVEIDLARGTPDETVQQAWPLIEARLADREKELTRPWLMYFARHFSLEEIDAQWVEHLKTMESLRESIGLQSYGQKDPKKEYKKTGFDLFAAMMDAIVANAASKLFRVQLKREESQVPSLETKGRKLIEVGAVEGKSDEEEAAAQQRASGAAVKRAPTNSSQQQARRAPNPESEDAKIETVRRDRPKVGRNDPCPCGSGKKYKKCHGKDEVEAADGAAE